jgi:hypothetical protein
LRHIASDERSNPNNEWPFVVIVVVIVVRDDHRSPSSMAVAVMLGIIGMATGRLTAPGEEALGEE